MKKRFCVLLCLALGLSLFACAGEAEKAPNATQAQPGATKAAADSAEQPKTEAGDAPQAMTKSFDTAKGPVEIPVAPQKIVSDYYLGEFLAVGVKPIIASPYALSNPYLASYIDGIEPLNITSSETALEMISMAEPDLIVTLSEADYEKFSQIAPTVYIPYDKYSAEDLFYYIADMVGKQTDAKAYMDEFHAATAAEKDKVQKIVGDRTVSFVEVWPSELYVMGSHFGRGGSILFDEWGLKAPAKVQAEMVEGDKAFEVISQELLPEYAGDFIFYGILAGADSAPLESSAVWKSLPAVQNGNVKSYEQVAFMHSDPISLKAQLAYYVEYFASLG